MFTNNDRQPNFLPAFFYSVWDNKEASKQILAFAT